MDREALQRIGVKDAAAAKEKYDTLRKTMTAEEAAKALGDEGLANQYEQQSVQDRFAQSIEKLKEIFVSLAEPILAIVSPLMDLAGTVLPLISRVLQPLIVGFQVVADTIDYILSSITGVFGMLMGSNEQLSTMQMIVGAIATGYLAYQGYVIATNAYQGISAALSERKALAENASKVAIIAQRAASAVMIGIQTTLAVLSGTKAIAEVTAAEAATLGLATIAIIGGLTMVVGAMSSSKSKVNDGVFPAIGGSGYGKRTLLGPEGAIQLNDKDTVIAGTNLFDKGNDMYSGPQGAISVSNSTSPRRESTVDINAGMNARLDKLISVTERVNTISTLRVQ
jgi:hypothetical protein